MVATYYELPIDMGFLITNVVEGSLAYKAGLESGDIIISFDGVEIRTAEALKKEISKRRIGERARAYVVRGEKRGYIDIVIEGEM